MTDRLITADEGIALTLLSETAGRLEGMAIAARWVECRPPDPEYLERMAADIEKAKRLLYPCLHPTSARSRPADEETP